MKNNRFSLLLTTILLFVSCKTEVIAGRPSTPEKAEEVFAIAYELNGGENNNNNPNSYKESESIVLCDPSKNGYNFKGWYLQSDFSGKRILKVTKEYGDVILYAKWEIIEQDIVYSITYELNGGENNSQNKNTYSYSDNYVTLYKPTREGYLFSGWFLNENFSGSQIYVLDCLRYGNVTVYAKWTPITAGYPIDTRINSQTNYSFDDDISEITFYPITVSAASPDGGILSYQWFNDAGVIDGATESTYTPKISTFGSFNYSVIVTNTLFGTSASVTVSISITVNQNTKIKNLSIELPSYTDKDLQIQKTITDGLITFSCLQNYASYKWFFDAGEKSQDYQCQIDPATLTKGKHYVMLVVSEEGNTYSATIAITVTD